jgi:hypothetical protein
LEKPDAPECPIVGRAPVAGMAAAAASTSGGQAVRPHALDGLSARIRIAIGRRRVGRKAWRVAALPEAKCIRLRFAS